MVSVMFQIKEEIQNNRIDRKAYFIAKRLFDVIFSMAALAVLAVPMALIILLIKIESPGPAIFVHNRFGKNGHPLPLLKFRSMHLNAEQMIELFTPEQREEWEQNFKLEDDPRITKIGRFLRRTSLDELPQLFNILKGDMSLVGPRPELPHFVNQFKEEIPLYMVKHQVRPGITGWTQTHGRKDVEWHRRIELNVWYVDHLTMWLDIKILFLTVFKVVTNADNENRGATVASGENTQNKEPVESGK